MCNTLGCLECYACHSFTRYDAETNQFLKNASPPNFGNIIMQNWDLYGKTEKKEIYSLALMAILKL